MLHQIGPSVLLISEKWERRRIRLNEVLNRSSYKTISSYRETKSPGGGCTIVYNETWFTLTNPEIVVPDDVEAAYRNWLSKVKFE